MDVSTLTNEELLAEYEAAGCLCGTGDPEVFRAEILKRMSGPRVDPAAETLRPSAPVDRAPKNTICGWHNDTTPDVLEEYEEPIPEERCDQPAGNFFNCNVPGVRVCAEHKCRCRQPREPMATLDEHVPTPQLETWKGQR